MSKRQLFLHRLLASALALSLIAGLVLYQPKPAEAATYTFTQTNWAGGQSTSTASHPGDQTSWNKYPPGGPSNGLVGYWTLEEGTGTSTADGSGSGNTGTLTNGPTWTTGRIGKALSFDGSNDYVNMGDAGAVEGLSAISFGAWVNLRNYVASGQGAGIVISKIYGAGGYGGNSFDISFGDTYLTTDVYAAGSIDYANVGRTIVPLNSWTHIEVTWQSGSPLKLYVNGAQVASGSYSLSGTTHNVGSPLLVGAADSTSVYGFLDGLIDEVRIYNRALSASEVTDLYNATAQNFNITAVNSGADLRIATSTASSTTQTDDGTTNTGFNLAGKAFSNATTTGTGAGTDVRLALQSTSFSTSTLETGPSYYATSLALNSNGFPRILYRSQDGGGNYLRLMICNNISCSSSSSVTISTNVYPGLHSLVLAPDDTPRFAVPQFGGNTYNFYKCNNTDCSGGNFTNNAFDSGVVVNGVMTKASMALGSDGNARIAYYDETNTRLKFAKCNDATCSTSTISVVDSQAGFDIGSLPSMALGPDGFARISYNTGSSTLRFARCLNDACSSVATTTVVASGITNSYASYIALAPNDLPRISYLGSGIQLNYLQCNDVDCASISTTSNIFCAWWGCGSHSAPLVLDSSNFARMAPAVGANVWEQYYLRCTNASCSTRATSTIDSGAGGYQSIAIGSGLYQDLVRIIYEPSNGLSLRYAYEVPNYPASGTFTSAAINIGNPAGLWGNLSWNATTTAQTSVTIKARSATNSSMTGATDWASCTNITNGAALSTGGCVTNGNNHQYIQYQATLSTTDATQTPSLNDVTINYQFYGTSGVLTSSAYNSNDAANLIGTLAWDEDTTSPANTTSTLSLRTASSSANLSLMSWTDFTVNTSGCSKTSITVTCGASAIPSSMKTGADDQWFQYKITLASSNTGNTPTIAEVRVQYVVNAPPQFNPSYGTGGVSVSQNSSSTDSNWGKVQITYQVLDPDTTSGTATPNNVSSSFEYNIGGSWTAVSASNLAANDTNNKGVSAGTYT
ncbi:LamG domain-containing protein, partial [Candidatus Wolfebacteria bacterium]|nr:LamG domain-containing protein [Candidatus Wolfebacteria bacterium]